MRQLGLERVRGFDSLVGHGRVGEGGWWRHGKLPQIPLFAEVFAEEARTQSSTIKATEGDTSELLAHHYS